MQSPNLRKLLAEMKKLELDEALGSKITISNRGPEMLALVPIGMWILRESGLIASMAEWRGKAMNYFFHQFDSSPESMAEYLRDYAIQKTDRLLFLVYVDESPIGHIGLSDVASGEAVLDNLIRGESGGPQSLMLDAEKVLIDWAFRVLKLSKVSLCVQSRNFFAKELHQRVGFEVADSLNLRKIQEGARTWFEPCLANEATENFTMEVMELNLDSWQRTISV